MGEGLSVGSEDAPAADSGPEDADAPAVSAEEGASDHA